MLVCPLTKLLRRHPSLTAHIQLFCLGHAVADTHMLIDMNLGKNVKIMASEKTPAIPSPDLSSPFSSGSTPTPGPGFDAAPLVPSEPVPIVESTETTEAAAPAAVATSPVLASSPPRTFSPLHTTSTHGRHTLGDMDADFLYMLSMAHLPHTSYGEAASAPPTDDEDSCTVALVQAFANEATSSIPSLTASDLAELESMRLRDPVADVPITPEQIAKFESEQTDYTSLVKVKSQFDELTDLRSDSNKRYVQEVSDMLGATYKLLTGTHNLTLEKTITNTQQAITNPHFIQQYTVQKQFPITTHPVLVESWAKLDEHRVMMDSAVEAIDRSVYGDNVRTDLLEVVRLAGEVDTVVNTILVKLEELRREYKDFPSSDPVLETHLSHLKETHASYSRLLNTLQETSQKLTGNRSALRLQFESIQADLGRKVSIADAETSRLQSEQNLILNMMERLGRMYIEHELERKKQIQLSEDCNTRAAELHQELAALEEKAQRHGERVETTTRDTKVAIETTDLVMNSLKRQVSHLQAWTDDAHEQHTKNGIRALDVAHHSAIVKFNSYAEIWQVASASLADAQPEIEKLSQDILSASQARFPHKVDSARRLKKDLEDALPAFQETRNNAGDELTHLETALFPSINAQLERYGAKARDAPVRPTLGQ